MFRAKAHTALGRHGSQVIRRNALSSGKRPIIDAALCALHESKIGVLTRATLQFRG
jgi:hypothetical protein